MDKGSQETKSDKGIGILLGGVAGWVMALMLISIGGILCLTGIGAIIGIPMILGGLMTPFIGIWIGATSIKGLCPYCGYEVSCSSKIPGINCPSCNKRIIIREKKFYKID